jgi:antitoxin component YwqK of YwqJK toxin-antitoxin module
MDVLNNNLIEYVLNLYLHYDKDIYKLKQLYKYKFDIKTHIKIITTYFDEEKTKIHSKGIHIDPITSNLIYQKHYYQNGKIWQILRYKDSYVQNNKVFFRNGKINFEHNYKNGYFDGIIRCWNDDGTLVSETNYKNDKKEGLYKHSFNVNDKLITDEINYKDDMRNGITRNYVNGKITEETNYKNNNKDGIRKVYCIFTEKLLYEEIYDNNKCIKIRENTKQSVYKSIYDEIKNDGWRLRI